MCGFGGLMVFDVVLTHPPTPSLEKGGGERDVGAFEREG
jgi:hypothetical protein